MSTSTTPPRDEAPPRAALTYRSNKSGSLHAAYCGKCRVGYVEERATRRHRWQLSLVSHDGHYTFGVDDSAATARESLERAFHYWLGNASLKQVTTEELIES